MNIVRSFVTFMEDQGFGTFGTDIFIGGFPVESPDACFSLQSSSGNLEKKNITNENMEVMNIDIFYRSADEENLYETLEALKTIINSDACTQLDGYDTIDMECIVFPTDRDLENEDRSLGLIQASVRVYN